MRLIPEQKGKAAAYLVVIVVALGGAAYMMYGRDRAPAPTPEQDAIEAQAAKINSTVKSPTPVPDLPIERRPPRGAPNPNKP